MPPDKKERVKKPRGTNGRMEGDEHIDVIRSCRHRHGVTEQAGGLLRPGSHLEVEWEGQARDTTFC